MKRVVVLCDKAFEADGLVTVLSSRHARPAFFPVDPAPLPGRGRRVRVECAGVRVDVVCLDEIVSADDKSAARARVAALQTVLWPEWDLVVSVSTGGSPWPDRYAGSVVVGSAVMNHSPTFITRGAGDADLDLDAIVGCPEVAPIFRAFTTKRSLDFERLLAAKAPIDDKLALVKRLLAGDAPGSEGMPAWSRGIVWDLVQRAEIEMKFVRPPERTHDRPSLLFGKDWVAVTTLNVGRIEDLGRAEEEALATAKDVCAKRRTLHEGAQPTPYAVASLDTCHGLVRSYCGSQPFLFISGLTDRPYSPIPSRSREAQNYGAAFNAGVVASYLIERALANPDLLDPPAAPIKLAKPAGAT
ncbi:MAG TPA: hypothetical protein VGM56_27310 [Byssovorax sp.]